MVDLVDYSSKNPFLRTELGTHTPVLFFKYHSKIIGDCVQQLAKQIFADKSSALL